MKKIKITLLFCAIMFSTTIFGQLSFSVGSGISKLNFDTKKASQFGLNLSMSIVNFYFDYSSNLAVGMGEELNYSSSSTYKVDKISASCINFGYVFKSKKFYIIPILGYGMSNEIFQDPIGWDTYFYGKTVSHFNAGIVGGIKLCNWVSFYGGIGTFEGYKLGLSFHIN